MSFFIVKPPANCANMLAKIIANSSWHNLPCLNQHHANTTNMLVNTGNKFESCK